MYWQKEVLVLIFSIKIVLQETYPLLILPLLSSRCRSYHHRPLNMEECYESEIQQSTYVLGGLTFNQFNKEFKKAVVLAQRRWRNMTGFKRTCQFFLFNHQRPSPSILSPNYSLLSHLYGKHPLQGTLLHHCPCHFYVFLIRIYQNSVRKQYAWLD